MFEELEDLRRRGLFRELKVTRRAGAELFYRGKKYLDFASNDYLGLASRTDLQAEFLSSLNPHEFVMSSVASRLLGGNYEAYEKAEAEIGNAFGSSCVFFNSGYHANTGVIPAVASAGDLILADRLVHASIVDALKLSDAKWMRYSHNDCGHLRKLLSEHRAKYGRVLIVTESVFSMDGDRADIAELVSIKEEFGCLLYVDEAHAFGVFGCEGLGLCAQFGSSVDFVMCTLGKALASEGAFVVCSGDWRDVLVNRARSLIFTTALPPVNVMWSGFVFEKIRGMDAERARLAGLCEKFRGLLSGFELLGDTQICPLVVGGAEKCLELSEALLERGVWAPAVRHPTVPLNSARIRFSLGLALSDNDVDFCAGAVSTILKAK